MLTRKVENIIRQHLIDNNSKILLVEGARQTGKTFIIDYVCKNMFENYIKIDLIEDSIKERIFADAKTVDDFFLRLSFGYGGQLSKPGKKLIFIDEIQVYPHMLTMLKFLGERKDYVFIASASMLGIALRETSSIPMGAIKKIRMYPLDFEEFLWANGFAQDAIIHIKINFEKKQTLSDSLHYKLIDLFRKYLIIGGMPQAVDSFINKNNIKLVSDIQSEIVEYYRSDCSKYDEEKKLHVRNVYDLIPSTLENKKKRIIIKNIQGINGKYFGDYVNDFEYLISSGIALDVHAVSNPVFPLLETTKKNLLKLYLNDVGLLTNLLYAGNSLHVLNDTSSVNLGSVYECAVAMELAAHNHKLRYFDNKQKGEVDFLIDDAANLTTLPIEVKSGKDYTVHSALNALLSNTDYNIKKGVVLSNQQQIYEENNILYAPIYNVMFL